MRMQILRDILVLLSVPPLVTIFMKFCLDFALAPPECRGLHYLGVSGCGGRGWAWWAWNGRNHTYLTDFHEILHGSALTPPECRGLHRLGVVGVKWGWMGVKWAWMDVGGRCGREMGVGGRCGAWMGVATPTEPISMKFRMVLLLQPMSVVGYIIWEWVGLATLPILMKFCMGPLLHPLSGWVWWVWYVKPAELMGTWWWGCYGLCLLLPHQLNIRVQITGTSALVT